MLAYGFAPAAVVAPLGSVGVIVNEIVAVCCLKEPFRRRDLFGLMGIVGGVVMIIFGVPESDHKLTASTLTNDFLSLPQSYGYLIGIVLTVALLIAYFEPRYARRHLLVWLLICSIISSITVIAARGFSSMLTSISEDCSSQTCVDGVLQPPCSQTVGHWLFWVLGFMIAVTAVWSAIYLNKAMMTFGNTEVVPVYYCTFTLASIVGSATVYNEFRGMEPWQGILFTFGCIFAFSGVWLITSNRNSSGSEKLAKEFRKLSPELRVAELQRQLQSPRTGMFAAPGALISPRMYLARDTVALHGESLAEQIREELEAERHLRRAAALRSGLPLTHSNRKSTNSRIHIRTRSFKSIGTAANYISQLPVHAARRARNAAASLTSTTSQNSILEVSSQTLTAPTATTHVHMNDDSRRQINGLKLADIAQTFLSTIESNLMVLREHNRGTSSPAQTASPTTSISSSASYEDERCTAQNFKSENRIQNVVLSVTDSHGVETELKMECHGEVENFTCVRRTHIPKLTLTKLGPLERMCMEEQVSERV